MSVFNESNVEAGHKRLASSVLVYVEALTAAADLTRKALLAEDLARDDPDDHADYLAISQLGFRVVNGIGAATKLLDCGYFIQAAAIGRDIAEVGMLALYFSERPQKLSDWRKISKIERYNKFGRRELSKSIQAKSEYELFDKYFNQFSEFGTHPSSASIYAHYDGHCFQIGPHINEPLFTGLHSDIAYLAWYTVDTFGNAYQAFFSKDARDLFPIETDRFLNSFEGIRRPGSIE